MTMKEFAQIIKKSQIGENDQAKIIYQLFLTLGAKDAISESAKDTLGANQSPSISTIKIWLSGKTKKIRVSAYFPSFKIENEKEARDYLWHTPKENQWKELQSLFKEWYDNRQTPDEEFYINIDTDDFDAFHISFWRQFVSYFPPLKLWDGAEEQHSKAKDSCESFKSDLTNIMIDVFKECFVRYRVFEFIPKEIKDVTNSIGIYCKILDEMTKLSEQDVTDSKCGIIQEPKKVYCKWVPNYDCFVFCVATCYKAFWELKTPEGYVIIKCNEGFTYDMLPANRWVSSGFKYTVAKSSMFQDEQFDEEAFSWKECQGKIIIVDIDLPIDAEEIHPIIEDCYVLIDEMLTQDYLIDEFTTVISEKIIEKYEGLTSDNNTRLLYNDIKQYIKSLSKFKEYLMKFRNLKKDKSQYLSDQAFIKAFGMYSSFSDFEASPKPTYPFSEYYLNSDEAEKVKSELCRCHKNLIELYAEIINYEGNCTA